MRKPGSGLRRPRIAPIPTSGPPLPMRQGSLRPFSPDHRRCSGAGPAPRVPGTRSPVLCSSRCAFRSRVVHFALENDGWNCTFECEVHVSAPGAGRARPAGRSARRGRRPSPRRRCLSKSVAKVRIELKRRKRIVDIPRFFSPPIPARSPFATDLDMPPPESIPGVPCAPPRTRPSAPS